MGDSKTDPFFRRYWDDKQLLTKNTVIAHIDTYFHLKFNVRQIFDTSMNIYDDYVHTMPAHFENGQKCDGRKI